MLAGLIVLQHWRKVRSTGWLVFPTLLDIPIGLALLTSSHQKAVRVGLAIVIFAFAAFSLMGSKPPELKKDSLPWLNRLRFLRRSGMNGPRLVIYGAMRRWSAQHFRATLQGYFLPASIVGMAGYWSKGLWVPAVTRYYPISLPAALPAILLGTAFN
jgi:uncharacterized protein